MLMFLVILLLINQISTLVHTCHKTPPTVYTPLGVIHGHYKTSQNLRKYAAYEGIPYAQPPAGPLRFEDPVPAGPWNDVVLNATKKSSVCAQYVDVPPDKHGQPVLKDSIQGKEDCLYLNIYVPVTMRKMRKMPVIFFIHGGSFQYASGTQFGDKYLADRDVVFITVNYRLGSLGFLSTEDEVLPGNLGLKDQSLALRWTSENIEHFGGDAKKIVLVGFSAGSSSIQYHYLSPMSRGLFFSSVAMSGTIFNPWGYSTNNLEKAQKLGAIFNCPTDNNRAMIDCLKEVPAHRLVGATKEFQYWQYNPEAPWAPTFGDTFLPRSPIELLDANMVYDVPAVYGTVSQEGGSPVAEYAPHDNLLQQLNDNWMSLAPHLLEYNYTLPKELQEEVSAESRYKYFGNSSIDKDSVPQLIKLVTDKNYFIGIEDGVRLQAKASKSPVYLYLYSFRGSQSYSDHLSRTKNNYGVCHTDEMNLVVENPDVDPTKTKAEWKMSNFLMDMWVSVAYDGVPNVGVRWDPVDPLNPVLKYLHISAPGKYNMSGDSNFGQKNFWGKYFFTV